MATLTINVPNAALANLDAYAQSLGFLDFRAYTIDWMKGQAKMVKRLDNQQQAQTLVATDPTPPVIT